MIKSKNTREIDLLPFTWTAKDRRISMTVRVVAKDISVLVPWRIVSALDGQSRPW